MGQQTVLVVAANDLSRRLTVEALELYGHTVLAVDATESAAEILRSGRKVSALVVDADHAAETETDFDEAPLDGLALARLAREIDRRVVVVYTARRPQALPERGKVRGAPTLRTPFWPHQLTSVLAELRAEPGARGLERAA